MTCKVQKWTEFWTKIYIRQRSQCSNSTTKDWEWNSSPFALWLCSKIQSFRVAPWGWGNTSSLRDDSHGNEEENWSSSPLGQWIVIEWAATFTVFLILVFSVFSGGLLVVVNKQWEISLWRRQDLYFRRLGMYCATYKQLVPNKLPKFYFDSPNSMQKRQILMNLASCWAKHAQVNLHKWWHKLQFRFVHFLQPKKRQRLFVVVICAWPPSSILSLKFIFTGVHRFRADTRNLQLKFWCSDGVLTLL